MARFLLLMLVLLGAGGLAAVAHAGEDKPADHVFVEVSASPDAVFVGAPISVRLRVGFDAAYLEKHAAPLFRRMMDVPIHVRAPWMPALPGTQALEPEAAGEDDDPSVLRFALNDDVLAGRIAEVVLRGGRKYTVLVVERRYLPTSAGALEIPAPTLRFVHATQFEEDFVGGRTAVDPTDIVVGGAALAFRVLPLPEKGRPASFRGAVGRYTIRSEADRAAVERGEVFRLTLVIEGEGNLGVLEPPRLDDLAGFHVYGRLDDRGWTQRTIVYEVAAVGNDVSVVPAIPLPFFDPGPPPDYGIALTAPIPLEVRAPAGDSARTPASRERRGTDAWSWWVLLAVVLVGAMLTWYVVRRGIERDDVAVEAAGLVRVRAATAALRAAIGKPGADLAEVFAEYVAARLDRPAAAAVSPELRARLAEAGVRGALAERAATTLEGLVAERYGGGEGSVAIESSLVDDLEAAFGQPHA